MNIYQQALAVQDACNLSGVVHSFSQVIQKVWEEVRANGGGTNEVNTHPVCVLFADKIAHLTGTQGSFGGPTIGKAYDECHKHKDDPE